MTCAHVCLVQVRNILLTNVIFCGPFFLMFGYLNSVAIAYKVRAWCTRSNAHALLLHGGRETLLASPLGR